MPSGFDNGIVLLLLGAALTLGVLGGLQFLPTR